MKVQVNRPAIPVVAPEAEVVITLKESEAIVVTYIMAKVSENYDFTEQRDSFIAQHLADMLSSRLGLYHEVAWRKRFAQLTKKTFPRLSLSILRR